MVYEVLGDGVEAFEAAREAKPGQRRRVVRDADVRVHVDARGGEFVVVVVPLVRRDLDVCVDETALRCVPVRVCFCPEERAVCVGGGVVERRLEELRVEGDHATPATAHADGILLVLNVPSTLTVSSSGEERVQRQTHPIAFEVAGCKCVVEFEGVDEVDRAGSAVLRDAKLVDVCREQQLKNIDGVEIYIVEVEEFVELDVAFVEGFEGAVSDFCEVCDSFHSLRSVGKSDILDNLWVEVLLVHHRLVAGDFILERLESSSRLVPGVIFINTQKDVSRPQQLDQLEYVLPPLSTRKTAVFIIYTSRNKHFFIPCIPSSPLIHAKNSLSQALVMQRRSRIGRKEQGRNYHQRKEKYRRIPQQMAQEPRQRSPAIRLATQAPGSVRTTRAMPSSEKRDCGDDAFDDGGGGLMQVSFACEAVRLKVSIVELEAVAGLVRRVTRQRIVRWFEEAVGPHGVLCGWSFAV